MLLLALVAACGGGEQPGPSSIEPLEHPSIVAVPAPEPTEARPSPTGEPVPVELYFYGVSALHKSFFTNAAGVGSLGDDLGACLTDNAQVVISWSHDEQTGRIFLKVPPGAMTACLPTVSGNDIDLSPLEPVGVALAAYRDRVAGNFDMRVSAFHIGVSFTRGAKVCTLWAAGSHPPDGRAWSPRIETANEELRLGTEDGVTRLTAKGGDLRYLSDCFGQ